MQRALFAEIRAYLAVLERDDVAVYGARIAARIVDEPGYFPVIPSERNDAIFNAIVGEIHVLPRDTVDPVVLYYSQLNAIVAMIADLRSIDLAKIGPERAASMYRDYIAMKVEAVEMGQTALLAIRSNIDGRGTGANARGGRAVNSPASDRSGR